MISKVGTRFLAYSFALLHDSAMFASRVLSMNVITVAERDATFTLNESTALNAAFTDATIPLKTASATLTRAKALTRPIKASRRPFALYPRSLRDDFSLPTL